ncbi:MAG: tetratricopeptide repeat protein [Myxococcota bacterium]
MVGWTRQWGVIGLALALNTAAMAGSAAEARLRAGDMAGAIPLAQAEAARAPNDLDAQELYIDVATHLGVQDAVEADYRKRLEKEPANPNIYYLLGRLSKDASEATAHYERALSLQASHPRAPMGLAAVYRGTGKLASAEAAYRKALERDPSLSEAWAGLQATLLQLDRLPDAAAEARKALLAVPDEPDAYVAVATLQPESALDVLKLGVQRIPDDPRLRNVYARYLLRAGNGPAAMVQTQAALRLAPGYPEADFLRMVARSMSDGSLDKAGWEQIRATQAERDVSKVEPQWSSLVLAYPNSVVSWLGRGKVRGARGNLTGARQDLSRALSLGSDEVEVQASYGLLLLQQNLPDKALPWLQKASSARPQDGSLAAAYIRAAAVAAPPEDARKVAVQAYKAHPWSRSVVLATAAVLSSQGDPNAAYLALRDAIPKVPDPVVMVALAAAARDAGHLEEAATLLAELARTTKSDKIKAVAERVKAEAIAAKNNPEP